MTRLFLICATMMLAAAAVAGGLDRKADPLSEAYRPVTEITDSGFTLQWFTAEPAPSRIMLRQDDISMTAWGGATEASRRQ